MTTILELKEACLPSGRRGSSLYTKDQDDISEAIFNNKKSKSWTTALRKKVRKGNTHIEIKSKKAKVKIRVTSGMTTKLLRGPIQDIYPK